MADVRPTSRELDALKVLWKRQRATVQEICDDLCPPGEELPYTTVLSLMQAMERKGLVGHEKAGKAYVYFAKAERNQAFRSLSANLLHKVFDGAMDEYLARAIEANRPSLEELERLEATVREAKKRIQTRPTKKRKKR